jgi:glycosyltransferase involved in cell wall biosynthesis
LFVALLCEGKGVLVAIEAVQELLRAGADIELTCLGIWESCEFEESAAALIEQQFRPRFNFPGVVMGAEKWEYYRNAHIFLYPSFYDTFPVVLLEAMCFGLPIVTTTWHGIPDVVEEGSCALLCQPKDVECCRDALAKLVNDPSLQDKMGRKSRERYLSHFTIEAHRKAMEHALSQLRG